jgi:hypothetical protein
MRAAYVPVLAVRKTVNFARDYSYRRREIEGRFGETVDTLDQRVEPDLADSGFK